MNPQPETPLHAEAPSGGWRLPLILAMVIGLGVLGAILWLGRPDNKRPGPVVPARLPPLSAEAEQYLGQIEISPGELSRWENFLGQQVTYVDFDVLNRGSRTVQAMEVSVEFNDSLGQVVLRETVRAVGGPRPLPGRPTGPLAPGEGRPVQAAFEHIPPDWDRLPPRIRVTGLLLQ